MEEPVIFHVWFATKRRKWLLQGELGSAVQELLQRIAQEKMIDLLECATVVDHVHLLTRVAPHGLSEAMRILKGASSYQAFRKFPELKIDAGTNSFWQARYGAKVVPPEAVSLVSKYIRTQDRRLEKFDRD